MLHLELKNIKELEELHYQAVRDSVNRMKNSDRATVKRNVVQLPGLDLGDGDEPDGWLRPFILADTKQLNEWVTKRPDLLSFTQLLRVYTGQFANGPKQFVDDKKTYNSIALHKAMDIRVCPYCDDQSLYIIETDDGTRRTSEFDHFFPKAEDKYPALAMCFYNLVISCHTCNKVKLTGDLGVSPYDDSIESLSHFEHNIPIGTNIEAFPEEDFELSFKTSGGMTQNNAVLHIGSRYQAHTTEAFHMLKKAQLLSSDKIGEICRLLNTTPENLKTTTMGKPFEEGKLQQIHQKLKKDLTGF